MLSINHKKVGLHHYFQSWKNIAMYKSYNLK